MSDFLFAPSKQADTNRMSACYRSRRVKAFSLIEVVFALGLFSFSILTIMGLMATGLSSAGDSSHNLAVTNIQRLLRANLTATDYTNITSTVAAPSYFTQSGYPTTQGSSSPNNPYYCVTYTNNCPTGSIVNSSIAKVLQVSVLYPYPTNIRTNSFSLFIAQ